jgi:hypothetical protein
MSVIYDNPDLKSLAIVKIHSEEYIKDFGSSACDYSNHAISNMFANFKKIHLYIALHIRNLCRRQGLLCNEHPQFATPKGKAIVLLAEDYRKALQEGIEIVNNVNDIADDIQGKKPFHIVGDPTSEAFKMRL